jgi:hypothetical protein
VPIQISVSAPAHLGDVLRLAPNPLRGEASVRPAARALRILFLVSAHNSLSQRVQIALRELGHEVSVSVVSSPAEMEAAVVARRP